ncbi:MAG TPA: cytochrome c-type biogenesis protein CcmH [Thermoleophilaceae bacterium]|nr:cytochrome c-type biogenesis protein CcmH [Thermoleophilaceae bacterium]
MRTAVLALVAALAVAPAASAACPQTSLGDLEDEVMCPACGTSLAIASENQPLAQRQRAFIEGLIADCKSKEEVKTALAAEFGDEVLALPDDDGFEIAAYLVPAAVLLGAGTAIVIGVRRWRRRATAAPAGAPTSAADSERLDDDLARYDL